MYPEDDYEFENQEFWEVEENVYAKEQALKDIWQYEKEFEDDGAYAD